jgi:hypothetical protein
VEEQAIQLRIHLLRQRLPLRVSGQPPIWSGAFRCRQGGGIEHPVQQLRQLAALLFVEKLPARTVLGKMPAEWPALAAELGELELPDFLPWGKGMVGFAPQGTEAGVRSLCEAIEPDVILHMPLGEDQILFADTYKGMTRDTHIHPLRHALKYHHRRVGKENVYFLVNESDRELSGILQLLGGPVVEEWIPQTGERLLTGWHMEYAGRTAIALELAPWQSRLLVLRAGEPPATSREKVKQRRWLDHWRWEVGGTEWSGHPPSWHELGLARYSGTGTYRTTFLQRQPLRGGERLILDLGTVLETAEVTVNGVDFGPLAFPPYRVEITKAVHEGKNELVVVVANTHANDFELQERPSGLLGPVEVMTVVREEVGR